MRSKLITLALISINLLFYVVFSFLDKPFLSICFYTITWLIFFVSYFKKKTLKISRIFIFIVINSVANIFAIATWGSSNELITGFINVIYLFGYLVLLSYVFSKINFNDIKENYKSYAVILFLFSTVAVYFLTELMYKNTDIYFPTLRFFIEVIYNLAIVLLFSLALINLIQYDSKKNLLLFIIVMCFVFSEIIKITSLLYVEDSIILICSRSILNSLACIVLYSFLNLRGNTYFKMLS